MNDHSPKSFRPTSEWTQHLRPSTSTFQSQMSQTSDTPNSSDIMKTPLEHKIAEYLQVGGLWNPELMEHDKVRDMIMECREALAVQRERISSLDLGQIQIAAIANDMEQQRDAAREDARRLASDLRTIQSIINDNESVFGYCTIGNKSLAAHEALTAKNYQPTF